MTGLLAIAEIDIAATPAAVWTALTDPDLIKRYYMGATVETDWQPGSPISWSGEYKGHSFADHGTVIDVRPEELLVMTHFSPMSGQPDKPENYHTITYRLAALSGGTHLRLEQDNNASDGEVEHARDNWKTMLTALKHVVEGS